MTAPAPYTTWRKHWPDCAHGRRYTYGVLRVEVGTVFWRRSDGLRGQTPVSEWGAYTPANEPPPTWREVRGFAPSRNVLAGKASGRAPRMVPVPTVARGAGTRARRSA